jgi:hypothetical protein
MCYPVLTLRSVTPIHPSRKYVTLGMEPRFRVCDISRDVATGGGVTPPIIPLKVGQKGNVISQMKGVKCPMVRECFRVKFLPMQD